MDAAVAVLQSLLGAFLAWGAFLCLFRRDRRAPMERLPNPGRRRRDPADVAGVRFPASAVNEEPIPARKRRLAA
jgi:hypothetical protein